MIDQRWDARATMATGHHLGLLWSWFLTRFQRRVLINGVCVCVCVETGRPGGSNSAFIREFLTLLAVCHTVIPECHDVDPSVIHYHAASPGPFAHTRLTIGTCFQVGSADCISAGIGTWYDSLARDGFFPFPLLCTSQVQVFSSFLWVVISRNVPPPS